MKQLLLDKYMSYNVKHFLKSMKMIMLNTYLDFIIF